MSDARRILIIDDNVVLAENIAEILGMDGHATAVAASAEEAFQIARQSQPDVVIADYHLPGLTGAEFVRQLKLLRTKVHAVVISAYTDDRTIGEARDAGATFLPKPVDFTILVRMVREGSA